MLKNLGAFLLGFLFVIGHGEAAWEQPPHSFAPANGNGGIAISSDAFGNAIAVVTDMSIPAIVAFTYTSATDSWSSGTVIGPDNGSAAPVLQEDPSGTALAIWNNNGVLRSAYFNGTAWSTPSPDPFATSVNPFEPTPSLSMNGPTTALCVYNEFIFGNNAYATFFSSGVWSSPQLLSSTATFSKGGYSSNGTAVALWVDTVTGALIVDNYIGGTWQAPITLDTVSIAPFPTGNWAVGIDASGRAVAVWQNASNNIVSSTFNGSTWLPVVTIATGLTPGNTDVLQMSTDPVTGTAVVIWVDGSGNGHSSSYNGTSWGPVLQFGSNIELSVLPPASISVNDSGNALVVYLTNTPQLFSAYLPLGGSAWSGELITNLTPSGIVSLPPQASLSNSEFKFAAWAPGAEGFIYFASVDPGSLPPNPPKNVSGGVCKNRFATETDVIHVIEWTAAQPPTLLLPTPAVVSYNIRRNGALIGNVPASGPLIFLDHDRCKKRDVYTVTGVAANGVESTSVTVVVH